MTFFLISLILENNHSVQMIFLVSVGFCMLELKVGHFYFLISSNAKISL